MAQVRLEIGGRRYDVSCRDGEEDRLELLGRLVDACATDAIRAVGRGNEPRELMLTALLLADQLDEARTTIDAQALAAERLATRLEAAAASISDPSGAVARGPRAH